MPQLRPEETASHDPIVFYHVAGRAGSDRCCQLTHQVVLELPTGKRRSLRVQNTRIEIERLITLLRSLDCPCDVAFEPTGDYHRPLAYLLGQAGCRLSFVSSLAVARTRDAMYNSWDKNDPKDAQVILHL